MRTYLVTFLVLGGFEKVVHHRIEGNHVSSHVIWNVFPPPTQLPCSFLSALISVHILPPLRAL